jgi:transposase
VAGISLEWLRQILRRRGVRWQHTKTWKESTDPQFWAKYRRIRRLYARRPSGGRRLCVDEFGPLNLQPRHGVHLARSRHPDRLRATYRRTGGVRHMLGVYDLEADTLRGVFVSKKNGQTFLAFLKTLRRRYRRDVLHIVLDNAGYHGTEAVRLYAASHRIRFYFTPTGASWLNRIESHFTALKKFALENTDHRTHEQQESAIQQYLTWRNRRREISLQQWRRYRRKRAA